MADDLDRWLTSQLQHNLPVEIEPPRGVPRYREPRSAGWRGQLLTLRLAPRFAGIFLGILGAVVLAGGATAAVHVLTSPAHPSPSTHHSAGGAGCTVGPACFGPSPVPPTQGGGTRVSPSPKQGHGPATSSPSASTVTGGSGNRQGPPSTPPAQGGMGKSIGAGKANPGGKGSAKAHGTGAGIPAP